MINVLTFSFAIILLSACGMKRPPVAPPRSALPSIPDRYKFKLESNKVENEADVGNKTDLEQQES